MPKKFVDGEIRDNAPNLGNRLEKHVKRFIREDLGDVIGDDGLHTVEWALAKIIRMRCVAKKINIIRIDDEFGEFYRVPIESATDEHLLYYAYDPQNKSLRLMKPWDDPGMVTALLINAISANDINKLQLAFENWDSCMERMLSAMKIAHKKFKETLTEEEQDRAKPSLLISIGLSVLGIALNAFGLSPLMGLLGSQITLFFSNAGASWYQLQPSVDTTVHTVAASLSFNAPEISAVSSMTWANAGADEFSQAGIKQLVDKATEKLDETVTKAANSTLLPASQNEQDFPFFLDQIRDCFRELRKVPREVIDKMHQAFSMRRYCLDFAQLAIISMIQSGNAELVEKYIVSGKIHDLLVEGLLKPTRKVLNEELASIFECPVNSTHLDSTFLTAEFEKYLWAEYFTKNTAAFKLTERTTQTGTHQYAEMKLGNVIANRLVELGIAERRKDYRWSSTSLANEAERARDLAEMKAAMQQSPPSATENPEQQSKRRVKIGKSGAGRRDLADVIQWSELYKSQFSFQKLLGINQDKIERSRNATAQWAARDYRILGTAAMKKLQPF